MSDDLTEVVSDIEGIELFLDEDDPRGYEFTEGTDLEDAIYKTARKEVYDD